MTMGPGYIQALIDLVEDDVGVSDWTDGSSGLCWPRYFELIKFFG